MRPIGLRLTVGPLARNPLWERRAAVEVCDNPDHRSLKAVAEEQHCKERSIARAVMGIDLPELTALHLAKTGRPIADAPQVAKR
jgi:hypothetical protein